MFVAQMELLLADKSFQPFWADIFFYSFLTSTKLLPFPLLTLRRCLNSASGHSLAVNTSDSENNALRSKALSQRRPSCTIHMSGNQIGKSSSEEFAFPNNTSANLYHSVCFQIRKVANKNQFKETDDQNATARSFFCRSKRTSSHITSRKYRNRDRGPAHASVIELNFLRDVITAIMTPPLYQSREKKKERKKETERERASLRSSLHIIT